MFILTKIADLVQIRPREFKKSSIDAIQDNINAKYANKVIQKIGLCICLWDVLWASEGLIGHGNGIVNVNVEFRLVVFRPFKGEVMVGRISSGTPTGIHIRTDFFDDIFVPHTELPESAIYDFANSLWVWREDNQDDLFYDNHEWVRFQVIAEEWHDHTPTKPRGPGEEPEERKLAPYKIMGSMKQPGLGCCLWWDS